MIYTPSSTTIGNYITGINELIVDLSHNKVIHNNRETVISYSMANSVIPIYLFTLNYNSSAASDNFSNARIYEFKIYENNVLVRDYIPVKRKSDNEICLYDKITNSFFTNQGTGSFIAGPEIN